MPPMETMACGAAIVTYDTGGCRDYARDGETALVASRRDVADLASKLERLVADPALRARVARAGATFVTAFDWERAVRRMEELLAAGAGAGGGQARRRALGLDGGDGAGAPSRVPRFA